MDVEKWISQVPPLTSNYWCRVKRRARELDSDGCTLVSDIFILACWEHDIHWRLGATLYGTPISMSQANRRFRLVIQRFSRFGRFSPVSWIRWAGVSIRAIFPYQPKQ